MARRAWSRWWLLIAALAGLMVGIAIAERGRFVDWFLDLEMNWADVPGILVGTFVGTGIAAAFGAWFADRLSKQNVHDLVAIQLAAQREHDEQIIAEARQLADMRSDHWSEVRATCEQVSDRVNENADRTRIRDEAKHHLGWRKMSKNEREDLQRRRHKESDAQQALEDHRVLTDRIDQIGDLAHRHGDERSALRVGLPDLLEHVRWLLTDGKVGELRQLVEALELTLEIVETDRFWLPLNVETLDAYDGPVTDLYGNRSDDNTPQSRATAIAAEALGSLRRLSQVALNESAAPAAELIDPWITEGYDRMSRSVDVRVSWRHFWESVDAFVNDFPLD